MERERNRFKGPDTDSKKAEERRTESNRVGTRDASFERRGGKENSGTEQPEDRTMGTLRSHT